MTNRFVLLFAYCLSMMLAAFTPVQAAPITPVAPVEILPGDFTLFGRTRGEFLAEWVQHTWPLSTNGNYLLPEAVPSESDPVYFLQRPIFGLPPPGTQTYFVPADVYVCFPIVNFLGDNVDTFPPFTVEELRDGVNGIVDTITGVHITIDGILFTNLQAYRTEAPVFSVFYPSSDNYYTLLLGHPLEGIVDPVVAGGYFVMLKPLSAGLHDIRLGATIGGANNFTFQRHFQIQSVSVAEVLASQTGELGANVSSSSLPRHHQRPLLATLRKAQTAFESGHLKAGITRLRVFQRKLKHLAKREPELAEQFTQAAQTIIDKAVAELERQRNEEKHRSHEP